jgi:hypothetical protein
LVLLYCGTHNTWDISEPQPEGCEDKTVARRVRKGNVINRKYPAFLSFCVLVKPLRPRALVYLWLNRLWGAAKVLQGTQ